jgi:hypothetical protein
MGYFLREGSPTSQCTSSFTRTNLEGAISPSELIQIWNTKKFPHLPKNHPPSRPLHPYKGPNFFEKHPQPPLTTIKNKKLRCLLDKYKTSLPPQNQTDALEVFFQISNKPYSATPSTPPQPTSPPLLSLGQTDLQASSKPDSKKTLKPSIRSTH